MNGSPIGHNAVEDELEVRNLLGRLARLTDIGTVDEYLEAFTDDAVLEIPGRPIRSGIEERTPKGWRLRHRTIQFG